MNLLFPPPGRIDPISDSHPQHTGSCHSPSLGLRVKVVLRKPNPYSLLWFFLIWPHFCSSNFPQFPFSQCPNSQFLLPFRGQCVRTWLLIMPMDSPAQNIFSLLVESWSSESSDSVHSATGYKTSTVFQNNKHLHMENLSQESFFFLNLWLILTIPNHVNIGHFPPDQCYPSVLFN